MTPVDPRRFVSTLRRVDSSLGLPVPRRTRILRELESDLEGLRESWMARGLDPDEARIRAEAMLRPDPETARRLSRVHAPLYERLTRGLPEDLLRVAERLALALWATAVVVGFAGVLLRSGVLDRPSPHLWLVLAGGVLLLAETGFRAFDLWVRGRHHGARENLVRIPLLAGAVLVVAGSGTVLDLYGVAGELARDSGLSPHLLLPWIGRAATTLSVALLVTLAGGLGWFCMAQWLAWVRHEHRELLDLDSRLVDPTSPFFDKEPP